jgi:hypothetical protein
MVIEAPTVSRLRRVSLKAWLAAGIVLVTIIAGLIGVARSGGGRVVPPSPQPARANRASIPPGMGAVRVRMLVEGGVASIGQSHRPLRNLKVWLVNRKTHRAIHVRTDWQGIFAVNLPPGAYRLGFSPDRVLPRWVLRVVEGETVVRTFTEHAI